MILNLIYKYYKLVAFSLSHSLNLYYYVVVDVVTDIEKIIKKQEITICVVLHAKLSRLYF